MRISVIVPAYNEEKLLGACLESVTAAFAAVAAAGLEYEVIVCDNNSSDATPRIAASAGAKVVFEPVNQISRSRNAGAAAAAGEWMLFIDADSKLSASTLRHLLAVMQRGLVCGGGAKVELEGVSDLFGRLTVGTWNLISVIFRLAPGSFLFCRADAFRETGGFSAGLYAGEEIDLSSKLKRWGHEKGLGFAILPGSHLSSGRKFRLYKKTEFLRVLLLLLVKPWRTLRDPGILKYLYDGRR